MPRLGEIRNGLGIGYSTAMKYMWTACVQCCGERWVQLCNGLPSCSICKECRNEKLRQLRGGKNRYWKGGVRMHPSGYVVICMPSHPFAYRNGYVPRARLVLENKLGRYLLPRAVAHHINGIKTDDREENLEELLANKHWAGHANRRERDARGRFKAMRC